MRYRYGPRQCCGFRNASWPVATGALAGSCAATHTHTHFSRQHLDAGVIAYPQNGSNTVAAMLVSHAHAPCPMPHGHCRVNCSVAPPYAGSRRGPRRSCKAVAHVIVDIGPRWVVSVHVLRPFGAGRHRGPAVGRGRRQPRAASSLQLTSSSLLSALSLSSSSQSLVVVVVVVPAFVVVVIALGRSRYHRVASSLGLSWQPHDRP